MLFKVLTDVSFGKYKIKHYYRRIEFLQCGIPRYHILLHLEDAPEENNVQEMIAFMDDMITCSSRHAHVILQRHKRVSTCQSNGIEGCRFPFFPMNKIRLIFPLDNTDSCFNKKNYIKIRKYLSELETDSEKMKMFFCTFLDNLNMDLDEYLQAIQSGIKNQPFFSKET